LEHSFIISEEDRTYLIIPREYKLEFTNQFQVGILKKYHDKEQTDWVTTKAEIFRLMIKENTIKRKNIEVIKLENFESEL
jgi:hypothetical protein